MKKKNLKKITVYIIAASCALNNISVIPAIANTKDVKIESNVSSPNEANYLRASLMKYTINVYAAKDDTIKIEGVTIEVFDENGSIGTYTTDENGQIIIEELDSDKLSKEGTYYFKIMEAPEEYSFEDGKIFEMGGIGTSSDGQSGIINVHGIGLGENSSVQEYDYVKIIAIDSETQSPIPNVTIGLYDQNKEFLTSLTTDDEGIANFDNLEEGTYFYKVEEAPDEYQISGSFHELVLTASKWITEVELGLSKNNETEDRSLTVIILDQENNNIKLNGAVLALYKKDGTFIENATTNENGEAVFENLTEDEYIIKEVSMPNGYTANTEKEHIISFSESSSEGRYTIYKLDTSSQLTETTLYFNDKTTGTKISGVTIKISTKDGTEYGTFSDTDGKIELPNIPNGEYKMEFIKIPDEYISQIWTFTVTGTNVFNFELQRKDEITSGTFQITVLDSDDENLKVDNVKILIENEDKSYQKTITTINGMAEIKDLPLGKYTYQFIEVPEKYSLPKETYSFELTAEDSIYPICFTLGKNSGSQIEKGLTVKFLDSADKVTPVNVTGELYKDGIKISDFKADGSYFFEGIEPGTYTLKIISANGYQVPQESFTINMTSEAFGYTLHLNKLAESYTLKTTVKNKDGEIIPNVKVKFMNSNSEIGTYTSDEDGLITVSGFTSKEISYQVIEVPEGYYLDDRIGKLTLGDSFGSYVYDIIIEKENEVTGTYNFKVVDENNNLVPNVTIKITKEGTSDSYREYTNYSGIATFTDLPLGNYTFEILSLPSGYNKPIYDDYSFEVTKTETTKTLKVNSKESHFDINFYDSNDKDSDIKTILTGFSIEVYNSDNQKIEIDKHYSGAACIKNAEPGEYYFIITSAPNGYESYVSDKHYDFTIGENQSALNFYFTKEVEKETGTYKFKVVDDNEKPVPGVILQIKNMQTGITYMETTDKDGMITFDNMEFGNYEFTVNYVPDGYKIPTYTDYSFEITDVVKTMTIPIKIADETPQETTLNVHFYDISDEEASDKTLLKGFTIEVYKDTNEKVETVNNGDGSITLENVLPGNYYYIITSAPDEYYYHITNEHHNFVIKDSQTSYDIYLNKAEKTLGEGTITLLDENKDPVSNVTVKVNNNTYISDESGIIKLTDLKNGSYTVEVIDAPLEYIFSTESHKFEITDSVKSFNLTSNLQKVKGSISVSVNNDGVSISDVKVKLTNKETQSSYEKMTVKGSVLFEDVEAGNYDVSIISVPEQYELPEDSHTVTINRNNLSETINIDLSEKTGSLHFNLTNEEKVNATIKIYGNGVDQTINLIDGTASISGLKYGTYHYMITSVPDEYQNDTTEYSVTLDGANENIDITLSKLYGKLTVNVKDNSNENVIGSVKGTLYNLSDQTQQPIEITNSTITLNNLKPADYRLIINEYPEGYEGNTVTRTFTISKSTSTSFTYDIVINKIQYGNALISVLDENRNYIDGVSYIIRKGDTEIKTGTTSNSPITENLKYGVYTIEFILPENYDTTDSLIKTININKENTNVSLDVYEKVEGSVTVNIKNENKEPIENVSVRIYGNGVNLIRLTDSNGIVDFSDLEAGSYTVSITSVPDGYILDSSSKTVVISKENVKENIDFEVKKETADITTIELPIKDADTNESVDGILTLYKDDETIGTYTSLNGNVLINNLEDGTYSYRIEAENYYTLENGTFTVENGKLENINEIYLTRKEKTIKINFVDADTNKRVEGVEISIDNENILVNGSINKTIKYGTYTLKINSIPDGYKLLNESDKTQVITVNDKFNDLTIYLENDEVNVIFQIKDTYSNNYITNGLLTIYNNKNEIVASLDLSKGTEISLPEGKYYAVISDEIHSQKKIEFNIIDTDTTFVNMDVDRKSSNITFIIEDKKENHVSNANITLIPSTGKNISLKTNDDGKINTNLKYDTYTYIIQKDGYKETTGTLIIRSLNANIELTLEKENQIPEDQNNGTISFEVKDEDGNPVKNITISISKVEEDGKESHIGDYKTDENGKVNISELENGIYHITGESSDYNISLDTTIEITDANTNIEMPITVEKKDETTSEKPEDTLNKPISGHYSGGGSSNGSSITNSTPHNSGWVYNQTSDTWTYNNHMYRSQWAQIYNPYSKDINKTAWFHFDSNGNMQTGWFTDTDGNVYYLQEVSDGNRGKMLSGWNWINGKCYYFNENHDGTFGRLLKDTTTPDGYKVNENGEWEVNGITVQR